MKTKVMVLSNVAVAIAMFSVPMLMYLNGRIDGVPTEFPLLSFLFVGTSLWMLISGVLLLSRYTGSENNKMTGTSLVRILSKVLGIPAGLVLFVVAITVSTSIYAPSARFVAVSSAALAIYCYCFFRIWIHCQVRSGEFAVKNGKLYFPGERYSLSPLPFADPVFVFSEDWTISANKFQIPEYGALTFSATVPLRIDLDSIPRSPRPDFDFTAFEEAARDKLRNVVITMGGRMSFRELMTAKISPAGNVGNYSLEWGSARIWCSSAR